MTAQTTRATSEQVPLSAARRIELLPSPWSTLDWVYDDPTLHNVLVPVD